MQIVRYRRRVLNLRRLVAPGIWSRVEDIEEKVAVLYSNHGGLPSTMSILLVPRSKSRVRTALKSAVQEDVDKASDEINVANFKVVWNPALGSAARFSGCTGVCG